MVADAGIGALELPGRPGDEAHGVALAAADADVPGHGLLGAPEFRLRLLHQLHDLAGPLAQQDAVLRQAHLPVATDEQLLAQLRLQVHQLPG